MSKSLKATQITFYIIIASVIFLWIASELVEVSETPTPTQVQAIGLINFHVHLSRNFSVAQAADLSKTTGIKFGIVEHPGQGYKITDDRTLDQYIKMLEPYPVYKGLQPVFTNWAKDFSEKMLDKLDFVLMDAMTMPNEDGTWTRIWRPNTVVKDPQKFMERYVDFSLYIIDNEPIDIFAWPMYLPKCIENQYDYLWTDERMKKIITAAVNKNIAIEINEKAKVPSARFIKMAKSAGAKFTFGTDSRGPDSAHLDYCLKMVELCKLTDKDMFNLESMAKTRGEVTETPVRVKLKPK
jgi:histidinol phosphatase-like PHP family hydrolase